MTQLTDHPPKKILARAVTRPLLCGLLSAVLVNAALATDPVYEVNGFTGPVSYEIPPDTLPPIDATSFIVDNGYSFTINFEASYYNPPLFETWNTFNYTNYGAMYCDSGFWFDRQITNAFGDSVHLMAANFFSPGRIYCASLSNSVVLSSSGEFIVNATNIYMPGGTLNVGEGGLISITGQNVDLSDSTLTLEGGGGSIFALRGNNYAGFGTDTNAEWNPGTDLTSTTATPSEVKVGNSWTYPPGISSLVTTTPYYAQYQVNTNRIVTQYVFLSNTMSNVTTIVEFGYSPASGRNQESDITEIQFAGTAVNPATGLPFNNYILFEDNYALGANNPGIAAGTGIPKNFIFEISSTPLLTGVGATPGFVDFVNPAAISNLYSFVEVHCLPTTVETNTPSNQLTNYLAVLTGRIVINASSNLNFNGTQISGQNYLEVNAPNQLDKFAGAAFTSAYSDINVGQASGNAAVTNLVSPTVPYWSGTLAAWSTRFVTLTTNSIITSTNNVSTTNSYTVTNDYNVVIIANQAVPSTPSAVWNLFVHGSNSIAIGDTYNLLNGLYLDCVSLTLTTNGPDAQSRDGELNLQGTTVNWAAATPNLRYLTNNGAIRLGNYTVFSWAVPAANILSEVDTNGNVAPNNMVTIGTNTYTFFKTITNTVANQVLIATNLDGSMNFDGSMSNLIAAINQAPWSGTNYIYSTNTLANLQVAASPLSNHSFVVTARTRGSSGNLIVTTNSIATTNLKWNSPTLTNGFDIGPYGAIINNGLISDPGSTIYAENFLNSGAISSGAGQFILHSVTATLSSGSITASGDVSITADTLLMGNQTLEADGSLTLLATNQLADTGVTSGGVLTVGLGSTGNGIKVPNKPPGGAGYGNSLLGTTINLYAPLNQKVANVWAGADLGASAAGFANNLAVGRLILDARGPTSSTRFTFNGPGNANYAIYVDYLELLDGATNLDNGQTGTNFISLNFNTNIVIYYAQAVVNGHSVARQINHWNGNHLRWVPQYAGYFSSTNIVYPDGTIVTINAALAAAPHTDSDQDGTPNAFDPTPFFVASELNFTDTVTNKPPLQAVLTWVSMPDATNYVYYSTNLAMPITNLLTTITNPPAPPFAPITNTYYDPVNFSQPRFYKVTVVPNSTDLYGPGF